MASAVQQVREHQFTRMATRSYSWLEETASPLEEAIDLFAGVWHDGLSVESVRALIAVPQEIEDALRQYSRCYPEDAEGIERVLKFRKQVGEAFECLLRDREARLASDDLGAPLPDDECAAWAPEQE